MATQLQFRRGTTTQNGNFTGTLGEVSINTTTEQNSTTLQIQTNYKMNTTKKQLIKVLDNGGILPEEKVVDTMD